MIFAPFFLGIVKEDKDVSTSEKRVLAQLPPRPKNLEDLSNYPRLFETYYSDQFGLRDWLVKTYKTLKYRLGDSPSSDLTLGKDGWLFLGNTKEGYTKFQDPFGDVRHKNLYSDTELKKFAENISSFKSWLAAREILYIFVIPPNKHTVYFDKLPSYVTKEAPQSALDQLVEYLEEHTTVNVMDLRKPLSEERKKHDVYHKTDTHWNNYGANRAQYEILKTVETQIPESKLAKLYDMNLAEAYIGDLASMLGVDLKGDVNPQPVFENECLPKKYDSETDVSKVSMWRCDTKKLKALIYHDSFFVALKPYFVRYFSQSTFVPTVAKPVSVKKLVDTDKPDILIEEWVERKLPRPYAARYEGYNSPKQDLRSTQPTAQSLKIFGKLKFHQMAVVSSDDTGIELVANGKDPIIYLPDIELKDGVSYVLFVEFSSNVKSGARLYYSTSDKTKFPFSDHNSVRLPVKVGGNNLSFKFSSNNIGKRLRLDLIAGAGTVKITNLELKVQSE